MVEAALAVIDSGMSRIPEGPHIHRYAPAAIEIDWAPCSW
jgi:hypothetical protein